MPAALLQPEALTGLLMHISGVKFVQPVESHHVFGAGFLFVGLLMSAENLSGKVWHRSQKRSLVFPITLILIGWSMLVVTALEPAARMVHFSMGIPMIAAGWCEARSRLDGFPRRYADVFIVPALVFAALDIALFHARGPQSVVLTHGMLALTVLAIAALRAYQSGRPDSLARGLLLSAAVISAGSVLWVDASFQ